MPVKNSRIPLGDMSTNFLYLVERALTEQGVDSKALFSDYDIDEDLLNTPNARISIPKFMRLGREAIALSQQQHLGLTMGRHIKISDFGLIGFAALSAATLDDAISLIAHYERLNSHNSRGHSRYFRESLSSQESAVFNFYSISPYNQYNYFVVDFMLSCIHQAAQWLCGNKNLLQLVQIEYPEPSNADVFEQHFGCPVQFLAPRNALTFRPGVHQLKSRYAHPATHKEIKYICERKLAALEEGQSIKQRVIDLIGPELSLHTISLEGIAQKMGMASWSLRRKLKLEGYQFQSLLDETRREMAKSYVRDTQHNFTEIAYLLGFSNPPGFQRAFKRWTGISPGEYRQSSKH